MSLSSTAQREILCLICKSHVPLVRVRSSRVEAAGKGVFSNSRVPRGRFLCLYPGVYSAGLPHPMYMNIIGEEEAVYLGCSTTPSGVTADENAYILNLITTSGYLDGLALNDEQGYRLDENPSACGHLINHSSKEPNVKVLSFPWNGIVPRPRVRTHHLIPNVSRFDGAARFVLNDEIVLYNGQEPTCGAVFFATKDIEQDEELFLDYGLHEPYPRWAQKWYEK